MDWLLIAIGAWGLLQVVALVLILRIAFKNKVK